MCSTHMTTKCLSMTKHFTACFAYIFSITTLWSDNGSRDPTRFWDQMWIGYKRWIGTLLQHGLFFIGLSICNFKWVIIALGLNVNCIFFRLLWRILSRFLPLTPEHYTAILLESTLHHRHIRLHRVTIWLGFLIVFLSSLWIFLLHLKTVTAILIFITSPWVFAFLIFEILTILQIDLLHLVCDLLGSYHTLWFLSRVLLYLLAT